MSELFEAFNNRRQQVIAALSELRGHCAEVGAKTLAERIERELVNKLEQDRFNLVVVGEFNHGKTTFVNALLGKEVLPVGVTPTTATIHHVSYADEPEAKVLWSDGREEELPFAELGKYVVGSEAIKTSSANAVDDDDETPVIKHLDVAYPAELLRERIVLVDTPGVNDLCLQRADVTYKYIPQADAVLFVVDAGQPLKESERLFLRDKLIAQSRDKIIFVVAKADIWTEQERGEALAYIRSELSKLVEGPVVFPVSAEKALAGKRADSGMDPMMAHLTAFLAEERGRIVLDNAMGEGLEATNSLTHGIDARRRAARMSADEIVRRIDRIKVDLEGQQNTVEERRSGIREEVSAIRAWVRRDTDRFCDDVVRQLGPIIEEASVDDIRQHLAGFIEATFSKWAHDEADEVARALEELAERTVALMRDNARDAAKRLSEGVGSDVSAPDVRVDTFGYDLGVAALFSVGLGTLFSNLLLGALMTAAAPALAYYLKGRVETETRAKALEQAEIALRQAASKVTPKLEQMIDAFAERLDAWVVTVGGEVHRELIDVLTSAKKQRESAEPDAERVETECDAMSETLATIRGRLEDLRATLWDGPGSTPS